MSRHGLSARRQTRVRPAQHLIAVRFLIHPRSIRTATPGGALQRLQQGVTP